MRVSVYYNLHKKLYSVLAMEGPAKGLVIAHADRLGLEDVTPKVQEGGRQRVLHEGRKNIHAFLQGELLVVDGRLTEQGIRHHGQDTVDPIQQSDLAGTAWQEPERVTYNPYRHSTFVHADTGDSFIWAHLAYLSEEGIQVNQACYLVDGPREVEKVAV